MKNFMLLILFSILFTSCGGVKPITVKDGRFYKGNQSYYFVGTNYWYGPIIAAKNGGDRERLIRELDFMDSLGIDNLRILVGAESGTEEYQLKTTLQPEQGIYNDNLLDGLDFLLAEMAKRKMYAVLYLNNNWIWSGGMSAYLKWNGYGEIANPFLEEYSWDEYNNYTAQFHSCEPCKEAFNDHIRFILSRTNTYNGKKYTQDNTIMSWQIANEPRMFTQENRKPYREWQEEVVALLEELDPNTLISTGAEGKNGYLKELDTYKSLHDNPNIDYLTIHMWPKNWGWYSVENEEESTATAISNAYSYIEEHLQVSRDLNKPVVIEEYGFPREKQSLSLESSVENRDKFYEALFKRLEESFQKKGNLAGVNFWGFAGFAETEGDNETNGKWQEGNDFTADPPQEPQGLNSVFAKDISTLKLIQEYNRKLGEQ